MFYPLHKTFGGEFDNLIFVSFSGLTFIELLRSDVYLCFKYQQKIWFNFEMHLDYTKINNVTLNICNKNVNAVQTFHILIFISSNFLS